MVQAQAEGVEEGIADGNGRCCDERVLQRASSIVSSLASLGVEQAIIQKLREELQQLAVGEDVTARRDSEQQVGSQEGAGSPQRAAALQRLQNRQAMKALQQEVERLRGQMKAARGVMRKLYLRNVELEKELQVRAACKQLSATPLLATQVAGTAGSSDHTGDGIAATLTASANSPSSTTPAAASTPLSDADGHAAAEGFLDDPSPLVQALKQREETISQLQVSLFTATRRASILQQELSRMVPGGAVAAGAAGGAGGTGGGGGVPELEAYAQMQAERYSQIKRDYYRLLNKRISLVASRSQNADMQQVVGELRKRLEVEKEEREAEAAVYSSKLYESERTLSTWYAEKRQLEERLRQLEGEMQSRDRLDLEMERCVCQLFERARAAELECEKMRQQREALQQGAAAAEVPEV